MVLTLNIKLSCDVTAFINKLFLNKKKKKQTKKTGVTELKVNVNLSLKAPLMTAADDIHNYFFIVFQRK